MKRMLAAAVAVALSAAGVLAGPAQAADTTVKGKKAATAWSTTFTPLKDNLLGQIQEGAPFVIKTDKTWMYYGPKGAAKTVEKTDKGTVTTICKPPTGSAVSCFTRTGKTGKWKATSTNPAPPGYLYQILDTVGIKPAKSLTAAKKLATVTTSTTGKGPKLVTTMTASGKFRLGEFDPTMVPFSYKLVAQPSSMTFTSSESTEGPVTIQLVEPILIEFPTAGQVAKS